MRIRSQKKERRVKAEGHYVDYKEVVKNKYHLLAQYFKCEERRLRMIRLVEKNQGGGVSYGIGGDFQKGYF